MVSELFHINTPSNKIQISKTTAILEAGNSFAYHKSLAGYAPTPLIDLPALAAEYGVKNIYVKDESFRFALNAFKGLGASYAIYKLLEKEPKIETFCTATDGNHGRAVAWAAVMNGRSARIFVPKDTSLSRVEAIESEGGIVEKFNGTYEETVEYARIMADGNGWTLVQDTAWEDYEEIPAHIMAGYFTHFKELEEDLHTLPEPQIDIVFLQSGVGSWPAAAAWYYNHRYGENKPKLITVEPIEAAGLLASFKAGKRVSPTGTYRTMMAGLNCGIPSLTAWEILKETIDASIAIEDSYTVTAMKKLYSNPVVEQKIISGESGAAGLAGFIALMTNPELFDLQKSLGINGNTRVLCYNTEGATDPGNFQKVIDDMPA